MYDARAIEDKWRQKWRAGKLFLFDEKEAKRPVFSIDTPPPFTNGELHMGQIFWVSYIDAIARYKRMKGFNVLYPVGWDAHGFPTELAVEKKFGKGLPREEFYKRCVELSTGNILNMRNQMLELGASFDDRYEYTTTSDEYIKKVQLSLLEMYDKNLIYRASHPVEWCVRCGSGISREEAVEREEDSALNYLDFAVVGAKKKGATIQIATTRPELLHACVAIAVNPKDKRYKEMIGKMVIVPLFGNEVPIIVDEVVDKEFGTGAEMICTFGDKRDIALYYKHKLKLIEAMDEKGILKNAGKFNGTHILKARAAVLGKLKEEGLLKKSEPIKHTIKIHDRDETPLEFILKMQWFLKTKDHAEKIKETARSVKWVPETTRQRLEDWANFIEWDYNFSRNRVFGTPIPFWRCEKCDYVLPADKKQLPLDTLKEKPPKTKCPACGNAVVGENETCDGWIDTGITPMIIAGWPEKKALFKNAFPNSTRIQGTDIVRTWAFYTIYRTTMLTQNKPWENIIVHGMIRGTDGREMHKRFGNGIYLPDLTAKYPVDAVRFWCALSVGLGKDKIFSYPEMDYAKSFIIKLHNSAQFVKGIVDNVKMPKEEPHKHMNVFDIWILNRLNQVVKEVTDGFDNFTLYSAMNSAINFYWHEFADYYIENVKHRVYSEEKGSTGSKQAALFVLKHVLETSLRIFAPVIPFTCEEINEMFSEESVFAQKFPEYIEKPKGKDYVINGLLFSAEVKMDYENTGAFLNNIISEVRKEKAKNRIALNKPITAINIKVPDEYISAVRAAEKDLLGILKAQKINLKKEKEFSVSITI